jgi:hypothetical protein
VHSTFGADVRVGSVVVPPPGFYFNNDAYCYSGEVPGARRLQIGGAVVSNVRQRASVDSVTPI